jgi:hypothetical protein
LQLGVGGEGAATSRSLVLGRACDDGIALATYLTLDNGAGGLPLGERDGEEPAQPARGPGCP